MNTHDYTRRYWGHDYVFQPKDNGLKGKMMGWGNGIEKDDFILLENGKDVTRYKVNRIKYKLDPRDMWEADVSFAPRP